MYQFLRRFCSPLLANCLILIWYILLLCACLYALDAPAGEFRYTEF